MLLRLHDGIGALDIAVQILCVALQTEVERVVLVRLIAADQAYIRCVAVVAQAVVLEVRDVGGHACLHAGLVGIDGHDVAFAPVDAEMDFAHGARVRAQEHIAVGEQLVLFRRASLRIELNYGLLARLLRDDVDDAADRIRAVLCARRALYDLNALNVLRAEAHDLVRCTVILCKISHDGLTIDEDERMARLRTADGDADAAHRVHCTRDTRLAEDDLLNGLRLFLLNVLLCDDGLLLGFVLRLFLCGIRFHVNVCR